MEKIIVFYNKDKNRFEVKCPFIFKDDLKESGYFYWTKKQSDNPHKRWFAPGSKGVLEFLKYKFSEKMKKDFMVFDDSVEEFEKTQRILLDNQKFKHMKKHELKQPGYSKNELWEHQLQGFHFFKERDFGGLFFDMGCGKSLTAISLIMEKKPEITLILAPKSAVEVWKKDIEKHVKPEFLQDYAVIELMNMTGEKKKMEYERLAKFWIERNKKVIFITNYHSMLPGKRMSLGDFLTSKARSVKGKETLRPEMIICDESHKIKSHSGQIAKTIVEAGKHAKYRFALTGTPASNSPLDYFMQMKFLSSQILGEDFHSFENYHSNKIDLELGNGNGGTRTIKKIIGYKNLDELSAKVANHAMAVKSEDVLDLPDLIETDIDVYFDEKQKKVYRDFVKANISYINSDAFVARNAGAMQMKLQQICNGFVFNTDNEITHTFENNPKAEAVADLIEGIDKKEKIVIFTKFKYDIKILEKYLKEYSEKIEVLDGDTKDSKLTLENFRNNPDCRILLVQIQSGGAGIDLTCARYAIYYGINYSLDDFMQSRKRLHRPGQEKTTFLYYLSIKNSIENKIFQKLKMKQKIVDSMDDFRIMHEMHDKEIIELVRESSNEFWELEKPIPRKRNKKEMK